LELIAMILVILALLFTLSNAQTSKCPDQHVNYCNAPDQEKLCNSHIGGVYNPVYCEFASKMAKCGFQGILGEGPHRNCMRSECNLSDTCIRCFYCNMHCTLEKCSSARCTTNPTGEECIKCSNENCTPSLSICVGVESHQLPPPSPPAQCSALGFMDN